MGDTEETTRLTIIRTSDAEKKEIDLPLSTKLGELKGILADGSHFGPISIDHQRLFYLGRELKSSGRSLERLGLGKFKMNRVLHLHIRPSKSKRRRIPPTKPKPPPSNNNNTTVVDLLSESEDEVQMIENPNGRSKRPRFS